MSDPLSIAGSAVGIISLGLTVCGEIVDYGRAYHGYDEDIQNITAKADSLRDTLEDLQDAIKSSQTTQSKDATKLSKKVVGIEQHITRLGSVLKRYGPDTSAESLSRKARNQVKKTVYAFRKDALRDMAAEMESLQKNLQTALQVYIWKQNCQVLQRMEQMEMLIVRDYGKIPPSLLKDCCEAKEGQNCESTGRRDSISLYPKPISQGQRYMTKRYRSYSLLLGRVIEVSLRMTTAAGGLSICPSLKVNTILPFDTPEIQYLYMLLDSIMMGGNFEHNFQALKNLLLVQKLDPSFFISDDFSTKSVLEVICQTLIVEYAISQGTDLQRSKILNFILAILEESGSSSCSLAIDSWPRRLLGKNVVPFMMRLTNLGFSFDVNIETFLFSKFTIDKLTLLSHRYSWMKIPENLALICRRNAPELKQALQEKRMLPNELIENHMVLEWAFGWPEGVQILLDYGADPMQVHRFLNLTNPGIGYHSSAKILLRAGCYFDIWELESASSSSIYDEERITLLANELAVRRKKLRSHAENVLPLGLIPALEGNKLLDGPDCRKLLNVLLYHKSPLPRFFTPDPDRFLLLHSDKTVYHFVQTKRSAEALYQVGFLDTDTLDSEGNPPLKFLGHYAHFSEPDELPEIIRWHISKGANLQRSLTWTNESISHILTLRWVLLPVCITAGGCQHWYHYIKTDTYLQQFIDMGDDLFAPMKVSSECSCPCSPNGCTAISVVLREFTCEVRARLMCIECRRAILDFLYRWNESYWQDPQSFIRSLTFNALDLNHTCFSKIKKGLVIRKIDFPDREELFNDESDEEWALNEFEELLEHLEQKFIERGQPLKDFVSDYWYRCVKDYLLTRQPYDEGHMADARSMGVELEFRGLSVPEWMEECIARKVEEVNYEDGAEEQHG